MKTENTSFMFIKQQIHESKWKKQMLMSRERNRPVQSVWGDQHRPWRSREGTHLWPFSPSPSSSSDCCCCCCGGKMCVARVRKYFYYILYVFIWWDQQGLNIYVFDTTILLNSIYDPPKFIFFSHPLIVYSFNLVLLSSKK